MVKKMAGVIDFSNVLARTLHVIGASFVGLACAHTAVAQGPNLVSQAALIIDAKSGEAIFSKNSNHVTPIASITKLMTAMVVIDADLFLDEKLAVDMEDIDFLKGSRSRLSIGTTLTRREMLTLALMSSENRAASALGRHFPGGTDGALRAMNAKAKALGMENTRFVDTTGLSPGNVSTARDLALLVSAANQYPLIASMSTQREHYVHSDETGKTYAFGNSNGLVKTDGWDISVQKTGFIQEAGRCVVMLAKIAQRPVIMVLLDSVGKFSRIGDAQRIKTWMETGEVLEIPKPVVFKKSKAKRGTKAGPKVIAKKRRR
jgi:serine-type D-Ala-D-Ala endopeptidase (penicillin-binding protein 7)